MKIFNILGGENGTVNLVYIDMLVLGL